MSDSPLILLVRDAKPALALTGQQPFSVPLELTAVLKGDQGSPGVQFNLETWAYLQAFQLVEATRDANGAIESASIVWPDGVTGVFTTDSASVEFPGAVDAWHATYASVPPKLITQPAVTRDANGAVIEQPAITIV